MEDRVVRNAKKEEDGRMASRVYKDRDTYHQEQMETIMEFCRTGIRVERWIARWSVGKCKVKVREAFVGVGTYLSFPAAKG